MLTALLTTLLGALLVGAVFGAIKSRWLYVVVPTPYLNTPLSQGQVISLSITNAGFQSEDDIVVRLNPASNYEIIASTTSAVALADHKISLPRLGRFETVTLYLLVEGRKFDLTDIDSVHSKAAIGRRVAKKENAISIWQLLLALPLIALVLLAPFAVGTVIGRDANASVFDYVGTYLASFGPSKQLANYSVEDKETLSFGTLKAAVRDAKVKLHIAEVVRRGDVLDIEVNFTNNLPQTLIAEASAISSAADQGPLDFWDTRIKDTFVATGTSKSRRVKVFLPESAVPKVVILQFRLKHGTDSAHLDRTITF